MKLRQIHYKFGFRVVISCALSIGMIFESSQSMLAGRGLGSNTQQVIVLAVKASKPNGLKLAQAQLIYEDGDVLTGVFRIYCPNKLIRPTFYTLRDRDGRIKESGDWWPKPFLPKWKPEFELLNYVCHVSDFGQI